MTTVTDPDAVTPFTYHDEGFFHAKDVHTGFVGDYVETTEGYGYRGRITNVHVSCPEGAAWLMGQKGLGSDPQRFEDCRWVSILVHGGGSVTTPEQFVRVIEPFEFENDWAHFHFGDH